MAVKLQAVISAWKAFGLVEVQRSLDENASELAARQDESEESRKKLVELSREFKKNTPEDVRKQVAPLLKSFQTEIDNLNKRSKFVEASFLNVYKKVIDITDPLPTLEYCAGLEKKVGRLADMEIENKNLKETLRDYNEEFKEVRNQDVTIKNLKEKLKNYEDVIDETVMTKVKEYEKELSQQYTEKERLLHDTQESVVRRLQEAEARVKTLQSTLDVTQSELFELKSKSDESIFAKAEETDILMNDLERANQNAVIAQKEVARLQEQLQAVMASQTSESLNVVASAGNTEPSADSLARSSLEIELASKDKEIAQLVEDLKEVQQCLSDLTYKSSQEVAELQRKRDEDMQKIERLEATILKQKDYEDIKRELHIMKSVEFGGSSTNTNENNQGVSPPKSLEVLLLEKTKALQNENMALRQSNATMTKRVTETEQELTDLRSLVTEQKGLIVNLESDLSSVQSLSTVYRGEGEGSSMPEIVAEAVRASSSCTPPLVSTSSSNTQPPTPTPGGSSPDFPSAAESLLPIVSAQRERFRQRNEELEGELTGKSQQVILLQNELDSLRADNLKLYEKIKFLQSYQGRQSKEDTLAESRYSSQYEEALDPFSSFSRKEKLRRYAALSPFEKVTLSMGRFILGNKTARTVAFLYTTLVHSLVFLVLYKIAHIESCKRDFASDCAEKFAEHMHQVHGENEVSNF
ncbi:protein CASP-like [Portunus trituberculatus]|uniref:Protein CASP n=1 Tax=Portunus trituberculatus TaxID=210409 RepID=A0A5B7FJG0_PORTR|nr:protein CASP-like [Portunus trituberculatus]MPC45635.1 Protein CASP [Portunus trituberculatus]